jgi:hypothetical protein
VLSDPIAARTAVADLLGKYELHLPQVEILQQATTLTNDPIAISIIQLDISQALIELDYLRDAERMQDSVIHQIVPTTQQEVALLAEVYEQNASTLRLLNHPRRAERAERLAVQFESIVENWSGE